MTGSATRSPRAPGSPCDPDKRPTSPGWKRSGACVHLAGADFAAVWSGWVDGAIESGSTTAADVNAALQSDLSV